MCFDEGNTRKMMKLKEFVHHYFSRLPQLPSLEWITPTIGLAHLTQRGEIKRRGKGRLRGREAGRKSDVSVGVVL